jgi:hypothetical protein
MRATSADSRNVAQSVIVMGSVIPALIWVSLQTSFSWSLPTGFLLVSEGNRSPVSRPRVTCVHR